MMTGARPLLAGLILFGLAACGNAGPLTLDELTEQQAAYDGSEVVVEGRVAMIEDPYHYWIEDDDFNRVGLEPPEAVSDHVGEQVTVQGTFSYSPDAGRSIRVSEITLRADINGD